MAKKKKKDASKKSVHRSIFDDDSDPVKKAISQCNRIAAAIEDLDINNEFLTDVLEKVQDMAKNIEEHENATERQLSALNSWEAAVGKFHHRRR